MKRQAGGMPVPVAASGDLAGGSYRQMRGHELSFLVGLARRYGDIVQFRVGPWRYYFVDHPDYVRHILHDNHRNYTKDLRDYHLLKVVLGEGLVTNAEQTTWLRHRRLVAPAFHRHRIASFAEIMAECAEGVADRWEASAQQGEVLDICSQMSALTLQIAGKCLFGLDIIGAAKSVGEAFSTVNAEVSHRFESAINLPLFIPTPATRRLRKGLRTLRSVVQSIIVERRQRGTDSEDLLAMLMEAKDAETGDGMDDRQLRDEVMTLLLAGHETTAMALTWTWYLLAKHPLAAMRLHSELDKALGGRRPSFEDLPRLEYTRMVLNESLRMFPPVWVIARKAVEADVVGKYHIPAKSMVIISPYVLHRHPEFWTRPEAFEPERFADGWSAQQHEYAFIPFAAGPRMCLGTTFAMTEATLVLATIAQRFRLRLPEDYYVKLRPLITLRPRAGMPMYLESLARETQRRAA